MYSPNCPVVKANSGVDGNNIQFADTELGLGLIFRKGIGSVIVVVTRFVK